MQYYLDVSFNCYNNNGILIHSIPSRMVGLACREHLVEILTPFLIKFNLARRLIHVAIETGLVSRGAAFDLFSNLLVADNGDRRVDLGR